jgi:hypothetical protein
MGGRSGLVIPNAGYYQMRSKQHEVQVARQPSISLIIKAIACHVPLRAARRLHAAECFSVSRDCVPAWPPTFSALMGKCLTS